MFIASILNERFVLKSTFYFFKAFGLLVVKYQSKFSYNSQLKRCLFRYSKLGIVYNLFLMCVLMTINYYYCIVPSYRAEFGGRVHFDRAIDTLRSVIGVVASLMVLIIFCLQQNQAVNIANRIVTYRKSSLNLNNKFSSQDTSLTTIIMNVFVADLIPWLLVICMVPMIDYKIIMYFISVWLCDLIIIGTLLQYSIILRLIREHLSIVNDKFSHVSRETTYFRKIEMIGNKDIDLKMRLKEFSRLCELHSALCQVSEDLSKFYSYPMLSCTCYFFASLTFYTYYMGKTVIIKKYPFTILQLIHCCFTYIHYLVPLIILTKSVAAVILEVSFF